MKHIKVEQIDPAERKRIDRGIAKSVREYQQGLGIGPFATVEELVASLHEHIAQRRKQKTISRAELEQRLRNKR